MSQNKKIYTVEDLPELFRLAQGLSRVDADSYRYLEPVKDLSLL